MSNYTHHRPVTRCHGKKRSRITNNGSFLNYTPAVILVVSLLFGCFTGRFTSGNEKPWAAVTMPAAAILCMIQPTPTALAAVGMLTGITMESMKKSHFGKVQGFSDRDLTIKGEVMGMTPSLYGRKTLAVKVSQVWGLDRVPVNFLQKVSIPGIEKVVRGGEIVIRAGLERTDTGVSPPVISGTAAAGGWYLVPKPLSIKNEGRERLLKTLDRFKHSSSLGMLRTFSLGQRWNVDVRTRDIFRKTGTYHLLAISGVHVGAAILPLFLIGRLGALLSQRIRPWAARVVLLIAAIYTVNTYLYFAGLSTSALRASVLLIMVGTGLLVGRSTISMVSLSWCVLFIVCFNPESQPDLCLVLSALAVAGIIQSCQKGNDRQGGNYLKKTAKMTLGAFLFTLPVAVWLAGGISVLMLVGNLTAGLSFGLLLIPSAVLIDSAAMIPWIPLVPLEKIWLLAGDHVLMLMACIADLPISFLHLSFAGCLTASLSTVFGILIWRRQYFELRAGIMVFLSVLFISGTAQLINKGITNDELVMVFPPVGQADAAVIRQHGKTVLIDCGPVGFPGRDSPAVNAIRKLGVGKIDAIFLSHLHPDHVGGLNDILTIWPVQVIYLPENQRKEWEGSRLSEKLHAPKKVQFLKYGDIVKVSTMHYTMLGPHPLEFPIKNMNRGSMQLLFEFDNFRVLFTGDGGWDQVARILGEVDSIDLLKIPHHGSKMGFPSTALESAVARIKKSGGFQAVCPSDLPRNSYLPAPEVIRWFEKRGISPVYTGAKGVNFKYKKEGSTEDSAAVVDKANRF